MPNLFVTIPHGTFAGAARAQLGRAISEAAMAAEQIPNTMPQRMSCWVVVNEAAPGMFCCGGFDTCDSLLPCVVQVQVPAGVLDDRARARYAELIHLAIAATVPASDSRRMVSSLIINEVVDGNWGVNGAIWRLDAITAAAGYRHLQPAALLA
jgi:phenylpyruvate tautomerase PptA (4-oxalocrotonate tautomerase family)